MNLARMCRLAEELDQQGHHDLADRMERIATRPVRKDEWSGGRSLAPRTIDRSESGVTSISVSPAMMRMIAEMTPGGAPDTRGIAVPPSGYLEKIPEAQRSLFYSPHNNLALKKMMQELGVDPADSLTVTREGVGPWVQRHERGHLWEMDGSIPTSFLLIDEEVAKETNRLLMRELRRTFPDENRAIQFAHWLASFFESCSPRESFAQLHVLRDFVLSKGVRPPAAFQPNQQSPLLRLAAWAGSYLSQEMEPDVIVIYLKHLLRMTPAELTRGNPGQMARLSWECSNAMMDTAKQRLPQHAVVFDIIKRSLKMPKDVAAISAPRSLKKSSAEWFGEPKVSPRLPS